jgi:preprotein translocase subunit SecD
MIADANVEKGREDSPEVHFHLTDEGRMRFARATEENVGRRFAVVLEGVVLTAPTIEEPIEGGEGAISGEWTPDATKAIARSLLVYKEDIPLKIIDAHPVQ